MPAARRPDTECAAPAESVSRSGNRWWCLGFMTCETGLCVVPSVDVPDLDIGHFDAPGIDTAVKSVLFCQDVPTAALKPTFAPRQESTPDLRAIPPNSVSEERGPVLAWPAALPMVRKATWRDEQLVSNQLACTFRQWMSRVTVRRVFSPR